MRLINHLKYSAIIAALPAALAAALLTAAAWDHNPQSEFHDTSTGQVFWGDLALVAVPAFVLTAAVVMAGYWGLVLIGRVVDRLAALRGPRR